MSSATAHELLRALTIRADKLGELVRDLRGPLGTTRPALRRALDLIEQYPHEVVQVARRDFSTAADDTAQISMLTLHLNFTNEILNQVEKFLSHGTRRELSESLVSEVAAVYEDLGLGDFNVVLSHGEANNFSTWNGDLERTLFSLVRFGQTAAPTSEKFALFRIPRLEGAGVQWRPLVLGHEAAHGAVSAYKSVDVFDLDPKFDFKAAEQILSPGVPSSASNTTKAKALHGIAQNWATELICDAYALRQYGPAAVAALTEFLTLINAHDAESTTHPPGSLRLALLIDQLGPVADPRLAAVVEPWIDQAATHPATYPEAWRQFVAQIFRSNYTALTAAAAALPGTPYDHHARYDWIEDIADCLIAGRPGDVVSVPTPSSTTSESTSTATATADYARVADIVNAAWVARVEDAESPIDNLALKTIEALIFVTAWINQGGDLPANLADLPTPGGPPNDRAADTEIPDASHTHESMISTRSIASRLVDLETERRLVITPRLQDPKDNGIDLRLGHRFIVFRRTAVSTFDPLAKDVDPRAVQAYTELGPGEQFVLHPQEIVLGATLEYMVLPHDLSGQVITRSSYGRLGLLTATAVQVHPGFKGCLTLELANLGTIPITLTPGERIAQLVLWQSAAAEEPGPQTYHCPIGPEFSRVRDDKEAEVLRRLLT